MKTCILLLVLATAMAAARAELPIRLIAAPWPERVRCASLDNPEPDTLAYDDSTALYMIGSVSNYHVSTRFTPPSAFRLRSLYVTIQGDAGGTAPCSVWVHAADEAGPGAELGRVAVPVVPGITTYDLTLPETIDFESGAEFYLILGMSPGYGLGWSPLVDGSTTSNRSAITRSHRITGPWLALPVDVRIRAGGSLESYADLAATECFNTVNGLEPSFFLLPGDTVRLGGVAANLSEQPVTAYIASWTVTDGAGTVCYQSELLEEELDGGMQAVLAAPQWFIPDREFPYTVTFRVVSDGDADTSNNTSSLRVWPAALPGWYGYTNRTLSGAANHGAGWLAGTSFQLRESPATIDSIRVVCGSASTTEARIYRNDAEGRPSGNPIWSTTAAFNAGYTVLGVSPPVLLDAYESFTVAFVYNPAFTLAFDITAPLAPAITHMPTVAWLRGPGAWQEDRSTNYIVEAFLDSASTSPAVSPEPPLQAGLPLHAELLPNFPNPFNATTVIAFDLPVPASVSLRVYDLLGREVARLKEGTVEAGRHEVTFNGSALSSGLYWVRLESGPFCQVRKLVLMK